MKIRKLKSQPLKRKSAENSLSTKITIPSLPGEIIEEILSRLAVKSILRFRCVSKSWRSLIEKETFIQTHHRNSTKNPNFPHQRYLLDSRLCPPKQCSLHNLLNENPTQPSAACDYPIDIDWTMSAKSLGCYNGLVCILDFRGYFIVWNPSTGIAKKLPELITCCSSVEYPGFGWIESTGEYKVFAVASDEIYMNRKVAEVYSSKTKSWQTLQHWDLSGYCSEAGMCVSEKLYWNSDEAEDIVWFDLKSEVIGTIDLPFKMDSEEGRLTLGVIGGCLSAIYRYNDERGIRVWVMKEYGVKESWERVASLPRILDLLQRPFSPPLIMGSNGEILVCVGSSYLIYYPRYNVFSSPMFISLYGSRYIESLVSPKVV